MVEIKVCVGSSCHLKGSHEVIARFKEMIKKYDVEDCADLKASFCLGHCAQGVTVECNGQILTGFTPDNVEEKFVKEVYPLFEL